MLKRYARCDAPYYNELIGMLALREENYKKAVQCLKLVPEKYQKTIYVSFGNISYGIIGISSITYIFVVLIINNE